MFDWICEKCGQDAREVGKHAESGLCVPCRRKALGWDKPCRINPTTNFCEQHQVAADFGHYLQINPNASTD